MKNRNNTRRSRFEVTSKGRTGQASRHELSFSPEHHTMIDLNINTSPQRFSDGAGKRERTSDIPDDVLAQFLRNFLVLDAASAHAPGRRSSSKADGTD